jgi:hypothetical protein
MRESLGVLASLCTAVRRIATYRRLLKAREMPRVTAEEYDALAEPIRHGIASPP